MTVSSPLPQEILCLGMIVWRGKSMNANRGKVGAAIPKS